MPIAAVIAGRMSDSRYPADAGPDAADGEPMEVDREDLDEYDAEPEGRETEADDRDATHGVISDFVLARGGERRQWDRDHDREERGQAHQRRGQPDVRLRRISFNAGTCRYTTSQDSRGTGRPCNERTDSVSERLSPHSFCSAAMARGVACSPSNVRAALPGSRCKNRNVTTLTPSTTSTAEASRHVMYRAIYSS